MTATDELKTQAKAWLPPPPRRPRTTVRAEALPPPSPRRPTVGERAYVIALYAICRPGLLRTMAGGVMFGAFAAITRIGPHPFSLRGVVPVLVAGAVSGAIVSLVLRSMRRHGMTRSYAVLTAAGAIGGIVWWLMVRPASALLTAAVLGAALADGVIAFERRLRPAAV